MKLKYLLEFMGAVVTVCVVIGVIVVGAMLLGREDVAEAMLTGRKVVSSQVQAAEVPTAEISEKPALTSGKTFELSVEITYKDITTADSVSEDMEKLCGIVKTSPKVSEIGVKKLEVKAE